jgi:hypothetical protein
MTIVHWNAETGSSVVQHLGTKAQVALQWTGTYLVALMQSALTSGLDVAVYDLKRRKWSTPQSTSQNADSFIAPVFLSSNDLQRPYAIFIEKGCLKIMKVRELSIWPSSWMSDLAKDIGDIPLTKLMLPGSHDSASYGITRESSIATDCPLEMRKFFSNPLFVSIASTIAERWTLTQSKSLIDQLRAGVRYLDLRITSGALALPPIFSGKTIDDIYTEHTMISVRFVFALQQIKQFLFENPQEFVILDLQHAYGVDANHRNALYDEMERLWPSEMVPRHGLPSDLTLNEMWSRGYHLIVVGIDGEREWLWPRQKSLVSPWPNVSQVYKLRDALLHGLSHRREDAFFVLQGVCTEDADTILNGLLRGPLNLRQYASMTTPSVLKWLKDWPHMNIVMTDWVEDSSLVAVCLEQNRKLSATKLSQVIVSEQFFR